MSAVAKLTAEEWDSDGTRTPDPLFGELHERYRFVMDLFASKENAKLPLFHTKEDSAFEHAWPRLTREDAVRCQPREIQFFLEDGETVARTQQFATVPVTEPYGWIYGNPPYYSPGNLERAVRYAIEQAKRGSGVLFLIPSSTGVGWFQDLILRPCDVLDAYTVDRTERIRGYELSMQGIGYRQKVLFLKGRVPFDPPLGYPEGKKWSSPAGDSVLVEWRPPLR